MTFLSSSDIFRAVEGTWPPQSTYVRNGWKLRYGAGGGQRVSAATVEDANATPSIASMEREQTELQQDWLVMIRPGDEAVDAALEARGYVIGDPTVALATRLDTMIEDGKPIAAYPSWPPLAIQEEIWANGGIGPARVAVMARADEPKTAMFGRNGDAPVATAFVALSGDIAMLHALEVVSSARRNGYGRAMMHAVARWAASAGANWLAVLVVKKNEPALRLYQSLGLSKFTEYHYRRLPE